MKTNIVLFWVLTAFFAGASAMYTIWSIVDVHHGEVEWVGTLALLLCGALFGLIAYYLHKVYRAQGGELVEDRPDSTIDDGDPEIGHFAPWSWWPVMLGAGIALVFLGIAIGAWIAYIGAAWTGVAIVGWTYEYYRGNFGR